MYYRAILLTALSSLLLLSNSIHAKTDSKYVSLSAKYHYSTWDPTGIDGVDYETVGLNVAVGEIDFSPSIDKLTDKFGFTFFLPRTFRFMWTPEDSAQQQDLLQSYESEEGKNALKKAFVDIPIWLSDNSEVKFLYDKAAFLSSLTLLEDKNYQKFNSDLELITNGNVVSQKTEFEKFTAILSFDMEDNVSLGLGVFGVRYEKPYSITVDGITDSSII